MATGNARSLLQYWRHPYLADGTRQPLPMFEWLGWIGVMLVLSALGALIGYPAVHVLGHAVPADRFINEISVHPSWSVALMVLCGPILEELVFRSFMTLETKVMSLGLGFVVAELGLLVVKVVTGWHVAPQADFQWAYFKVNAPLVAVALMLAVPAFLMRRTLQRWLAAVAPGMVVLMTLLFAAVHTVNYEQGWKLWLLWLTLPQLAGGLVLVYLRVRHGLRWSIATHLVFDWFVFGVGWLLHAKRAGIADHVALTLLVLALFGLFVYGVVFLFRRGVLRPLAVRLQSDAYPGNL